MKKLIRILHPIIIIIGHQLAKSTKRQLLLEIGIIKKWKKEAETNG